MNEAPAANDLPRQIAIDGPAASGKTTLGRVLAERFGYTFLDTGLMYRALTLAALREGLVPEKPDEATALANRLQLDVEAGADTRILLNGEDVTEALRQPEVERSVSAFSAIPGVRDAMVRRQRELAENGLMVLAGRDIGTVVLPDAPLKLFLSASEEARAERRSRQTNEWGQSQEAAESRRDIEQRDRIDSTRKTSPLVAADDAIQIDTTNMTLEQVIETAIGYVTGKRRAPAAAPASAATETQESQAVTKPKERESRTWAVQRLLAPVRDLKARVGWETFIRPFYWFCVHGLRLILWVLGRWKAPGRENVPLKGPLIVVSNHLNNADPPILASGIARRQVRFMAKSELFRGPMGWIPKLYGAFAVRRFDADLAAMLAAERLLKRGGVLGMFPEGTRSRTGIMGRPHPGTALIALRSGAPVLPCAIIGTEQLRNPLNVLRKPRIEVRIGEPIEVEARRRPTEQEVSDLTERIYAAIQELLPPRYRPAYTESNGADTSGQ